MATIQHTLDERSAQMSRWGHRFFMPLMMYGLVLVTLLLVVQQAVQLGGAWFDDLRYGTPRSVRIVGHVGHGDERTHPTVLETININGQISVLVMPGGDTQNIEILPGPYVVGQDGARAVAHPQLQDVNGDQHVDLIVTVRDEAIVYINNQGTFRMMTAEERAMLAEQWQ